MEKKNSKNNEREKNQILQKGIDDFQQNSLVENYIMGHSSPEDDYLYRLYRATQTRLLRPRMASGHLQGLLLKMIVQMTQAKMVLEIGTYSGYSALCMAAGMEEGGIVRTYEINDEQEYFTRPWLENSPYRGKVEMVVGDALELLPKDHHVFDLVFIDANKRNYPDYYNLTLPKLKKGGILLADNTLWDGHVVEKQYEKDPQTIGIKRFNEVVANDDRVENLILPLRDGLTIIRKK